VAARLSGRSHVVHAILLALEWGDVSYVDIARGQRGPDPEPVERVLADTDMPHVPLAPPVVDTGERRLAQTANILLFLGRVG
jgi:hypothetical protein